MTIGRIDRWGILSWQARKTGPCLVDMFGFEEYRVEKMFVDVYPDGTIILYPSLYRSGSRDLNGVVL